MATPEMPPLTPADFGVAPGMKLAMTNRQEATVIAALRLWQDMLAGAIDIRHTERRRIEDIQQMASDHGLHEPLTEGEIDEFLADVFRVE